MSRSRDRSRSKVFACVRWLPRLLGVAASVLVVSLPLRAQEPEQQDRMAKLDAKTRAAVELLYDSAAAEGLPTQPLRSIALLGITRERVRQIKEKALSRLRHVSRARALESYLG